MNQTEQIKAQRIIQVKISLILWFISTTGNARSYPKICASFDLRGTKLISQNVCVVVHVPQLKCIHLCIR